MLRVPAENRSGAIDVDEGAVRLVMEFLPPAPRHMRKLRGDEIKSRPPIRDIRGTDQHPNMT
jgi:hypothetical protein